MPAYPLFLLYSFLSALVYSSIFTLYNVYVVQVAHLAPLQLVLLGTTVEASVFVFEVPTGVVADTFSRRISIIIGVFIIGCAFILTGMVPSFWPIAFSQVLWGLGFTFTSGATQAWISDEIGEDKAAAAFLRSSQLDRLGSLGGAGLGVLLGVSNIGMGIVFGGCAFLIIGLFLLLLMRETGFHPTPPGERTTFQRMAHTFRSGLGMVRRRPALGGILAIGLVYGLYSEGFDRLWTAHLLNQFSLPSLGSLPQLSWWGILRAVYLLLGILATEIAGRRIDLASPRSLAGALLVISIILVVSLGGFALAGSFWLAIAFFWLINVLRLVIEPLYTSWINHRLDSSVRATVISMSSQVDAIGQVAGGPLVGLIAQAISIRAGLLASTGLLSPVMGLFAWAFKDDEVLSSKE